MSTDQCRTGKPRCGARDSWMQPHHELLAQARIVVYFADEEHNPLSRENLIAFLEKRKVLPVAYGPVRERLEVIGKIFDYLVEVEKIIVLAPSDRYYIWYDPRLQEEYAAELDQGFGLPLVA